MYFRLFDGIKYYLGLGWEEIGLLKYLLKMDLR